jgi:hypothetical protein
VLKHYHDFGKIFSEAASKRFSEWWRWDHAIDLKPDAPESIDCRVYPLSPKEKKEQKEFLESNLRLKRIRQTNSPYASGFFLIRKKDGKFHPVQDHRQLNKWMIPNKYPLPLIFELIHVLHLLAYLWCHALTCTYIPLSCVPPDCFYWTCLPIRDSMDFAVISILSSYFLSRVTVLTFLISLSVSHSCYPLYSESPLLYPVCMSQFLLFAYDSFCYGYCTILRICQLITEQLMHHLQLVWLGL